MHGKRYPTRTRRAEKDRSHPQRGSLTYIMFKLESQIPGGATFRSKDHRLRIRFVAESVARITFTSDKPFLERPSSVVVAQPQDIACGMIEDDVEVTVSAARLRIALN